MQYLRVQLTHHFHKQIKSTKPEVFASWANNIMLGRLGQPEDVARVVSFLASKDASFITAETIQIGGGQGFRNLK